MAERRIVETARRTGRTADSRVKLMRAIRAACQRHGMDDDARRDMQAGLVERGLIGNASMADMTLAELGRLLDELNRGWSGPAGHRAHIGKVRALWWTLYWLGAVHAADDRAIDAFVRRQTGVSALRFLDHRPAASVIEALKAWAAREGVDWPETPDPIGDRRAVFDTLRVRLDRDTLAAALAGASLALPADRWQRHELDAAIRCLGKAWRRSGAVTR